MSNPISIIELAEIEAKHACVSVRNNNMFVRTERANTILKIEASTIDPMIKALMIQVVASATNTDMMGKLRFFANQRATLVRVSALLGLDLKTVQDTITAFCK